MVIESDVRQKLIEVLGGQLPLENFEDWLVSNSWNMHLDSSPSAQQLVAAVELALSEYSSGHRNYNELRAEMAKLLDNIVISINISLERIAPAQLPAFRANAFQTPLPALLAVRA